MVRSLSLHRRVAAFALVSCLPIAALAQTAKPPPRLPPNAAESARIPAGVDTGSPATSDALPLGTPVPPSGMVDRGDLRTRSAAARAAARPKPAASGADCVNRLAPAARDAKAAPLSLPKSGFVGSSAAPPSAASTGPSSATTRIDC